MELARQQSLHFGTGRAIATAVLGLLPYVLALAAISAPVNLPAPCAAR